MMIVRESADELSDSTLCEKLLEKLEGKEPELAPDFSAWRRMEEDDPDRCLQWLMKAITRAIELHKSRKNAKTRRDFLADNLNVRRSGTQMQVSDAGAQSTADGGAKAKRGQSKKKSGGNGKGGAAADGADDDKANETTKGRSKGKGKNDRKGQARHRSASRARVDFNEDESNLLQRKDAQGKSVCIWWFQKGADGKPMCQKGDKCKFSHEKVSDADLEIVNSAAARIRSRSASPGAKGRGRDTKNIPCRFYSKFGECRFGDKCAFKHEDK